MATSKNPQMAEVLVNVSRNRIATENDLAKYDIVQLLQNFINENSTNKSEEYVRHFEKHLVAIADKLGNPEIKKAYVPKQKFVFAE